LNYRDKSAWRGQDAVLHILVPTLTGKICLQTEQALTDLMAFTLRAGCTVNRHVRSGPVIDQGALEAELIDANTVEGMTHEEACQHNRLTFQRHMVQGMRVDHAREKLAEDALNAADKQPNKKHWVLWIDSDLLFEPTDIIALTREFRRHTDFIDGIAGVYADRWKHGTALMSDDTCHEILEGVDYEPGDIVEVGNPPMGFFMHEVRLFRELERPWFQCSSPHTCLTSEGGSPGGEDLYFFQKIREQGFRLWVHTGVIAGHIDRDTGRVFYPVSAPNLVATGT